MVLIDFKWSFVSPKIEKSVEKEKFNFLVINLYIVHVNRNKTIDFIVCVEKKGFFVRKPQA